MSKKYILITLFFISSFFALQSQAEISLYKEECGSCHMAYKPSLMATSSWEKLMSKKELSNHFGEDITYEDQSINNSIKEYLVSNSFRYPPNFPEVMISKSIRITDMPSIARHHRKIPKKLITQEEVKSISNCVACHVDADKGDFSEENITIPGYGKYDNH